ncbi:unnamed protein product [Euphydryas editha]|uniref:Peptidase S1 domain-containing protein n=1 Tax=Euphydryas editha TaxID=104508 RepID=A0AAU9U6G7_EUPED|nr:unnamed protein product [Euphydryas editha]
MLTAYIVGLLVFGLVQAYPSPAELEPAYVSDSTNSRVVGGWEATEGQIPYQVNIRMVATNGAVYSCGGSVIHKNWVLTAAHCTANRITYVIRLGVVELVRPTLLLEETSENNFVHPGYNPNLSVVQRDDIAMVRLSRDLPFGPTIQPIRLQNSEQMNRNYAGDILTVSGFGLTQDPWNGGTASSVLRWVYLRGISNEECRSFYLNSIHPQTVCATYYNNTIQSSCQGDSGGPLTIVDEDGELTQMGIVSFGSSFGCSSFFPSAYVRPGHYHDWIYDVTGIDFDWSSSTTATTVDA